MYQHLKRSVTRWRQDMLVRFYHVFGGTYKASVCGHAAKLAEKVCVLGEDVLVELQKSELDYCPRCLACMSIRCAYCAQLIFPGDPITLYTPRSRYVEIPHKAVIYQDNPLQLVGCIRSRCTSIIAEMAGHWVPPGRVERIISPLEIVAKTGKPFLVNDVDHCA